MGDRRQPCWWHVYPRSMHCSDLFDAYLSSPLGSLCMFAMFVSRTVARSACMHDPSLEPSGDALS